MTEPTTACARLELAYRAGLLAPRDQRVFWTAKSGFCRSREARACFAFAYAEPDPGTNALRMPCDSLGSELYRLVHGMVTERPTVLKSEAQRMRDFLAQDRVDSFAAFALLRWASA